VAVESDQTAEEEAADQPALADHLSFSSAYSSTQPAPQPRRAEEQKTADTDQKAARGTAAAEILVERTVDAGRTEEQHAASTLAVPVGTTVAAKAATEELP
jgi:hypothetical protein